MLRLAQAVGGRFSRAGTSGLRIARRANYSELNPEQIREVAGLRLGCSSPFGDEYRVRRPATEKGDLQKVKGQAQVDWPRPVLPSEVNVTNARSGSRGSAQRFFSQILLR